MIDSTRKRKKSNTSLWIMLAAIVAIVVALFLLPSCTSSSMQSNTRVAVGDMAPDFTVEMLDGSSVTLSEQRGKVALLCFWTTWCPHCQAEMAHVQEEIVDRYADRPFVFLPVSRGEERAEVSAFCGMSGYLFPVGLDPEQAVYGLYATEFVPRNFVITAEGRVAASYMGYSEEILAQIQQTIDDELEKSKQ